MIIGLAVSVLLGSSVPAPRPPEPPALMQYRQQLKGCYGRALRYSGLDSARLDVTISHHASGAIDTVRVTAPYELAGVASCVQNAVRRWQLPATTTAQSIKFPLILL